MSIRYRVATQAATLFLKIISLIALALATRLFTTNLCAQDLGKDMANPNWFTFGPQFGLNLNANFKNAGYLPRSTSVISGLQNDDPAYGLDLAYGRDLGAMLGGEWGLQLAFDFTDVSIRDHVTGDSYSLDGPFREPETINGQQTLDTQIYALRLGPYFEFPFGRKWSGRLGGGLALAGVNADYTTRVTTDGGITQRGSDLRGDFQTGGYLQVELLYALTSRLSIFAGAEYEYLGTFSRTLFHQEAQLNLNNSAYIMFGLQARF